MPYGMKCLVAKKRLQDEAHIARPSTASGAGRVLPVFWHQRPLRRPEMDRRSGYCQRAWRAFGLR